MILLEMVGLSVVLLVLLFLLLKEVLLVRVADGLAVPFPPPFAGVVVLEWVLNGMPSPVTLGLGVLLSKVVLLVRDGVGSVLPEALAPSDGV